MYLMVVKHSALKLDKKYTSTDSRTMEKKNAFSDFVLKMNNSLI